MFGPYYLRVTLKSNEHPFSGGTECARYVDDDDKAINWARGMAQTLGHNVYQCTLYRRNDDGTLGETIAFEDDDANC